MKRECSDIQSSTGPRLQMEIPSRSVVASIQEEAARSNSHSDCRLLCIIIANVARNGSEYELHMLVFRNLSRRYECLLITQGAQQ
jgi:hypothetical protein